MPGPMSLQGVGVTGTMSLLVGGYARPEVPSRGYVQGWVCLGVERKGTHHTCGRQTGGTHLTGMLSCVKNVHVSDHWYPYFKLFWASSPAKVFVDVLYSTLTR